MLTLLFIIKSRFLVKIESRGSRLYSCTHKVRLRHYKGYCRNSSVCERLYGGGGHLALHAHPPAINVRDQVIRKCLAHPAETALITQPKITLNWIYIILFFSSTNEFPKNFLFF